MDIFQISRVVEYDKYPKYGRIPKGASPKEHFGYGDQTEYGEPVTEISLHEVATLMAEEPKDALARYQAAEGGVIPAGRYEVREIPMHTVLTVVDPTQAITY